MEVCVKDQNNVTTMKDIGIALKQNKPGELAKAVNAIANAKVNIEGFSEIEGKFHCVTDDPKGTIKALESAGFTPTETDVLVFGAEDQPGYLANVLRGLADQEVNVITSYVLTNTRIALGVDQPARVKETLQEFAPQAAHRR
jgi:hypothetical protein